MTELQQPLNMFSMPTIPEVRHSPCGGLPAPELQLGSLHDSARRGLSRPLACAVFGQVRGLWKFSRIWSGKDHRGLGIADVFKGRYSMAESCRRTKPNGIALVEATSELPRQITSLVGRTEEIEAGLATPLALPGGLSPREHEILRLVKEGLTDREIAEQLSIGPRTVQNHIQHIYQKISVSSRVEATFWANHHGPT